MQVSRISSGVFHSNNSRKITSNQSAPIRQQSDTISFKGTKTTILGGIAGGLLVGYYTCMAIIAPPIVKKGFEDQYIRAFEYEAMQTIIDPNESEEKNKLVEQVAIMTEKKPEENITKGYINVLDKYSVLNESNKDELLSAIDKVLEEGDLSEESESFYNEYREKLNNN